MTFNTIPFLIFFAFVCLFYFKCNAKLQNIALLAASVCFYLWGAGFYYTLLLFFCICVSYFSAIALPKHKNKNLILTICVFLQIGILCFFKYAGFFLNSDDFTLLLPMGISFYTFTSLGYLFDVAGDDVAPETNFINYCLFVSFFAYVTSGPICRAGKILPQLNTLRTYDENRAVTGLQLMLIGFFKKIAVADILVKYINVVYGDVSSYTGLTLIFATVLYSIYLYCDFSGYSDIARGCAKVLGIEIAENFNTPYFSLNLGQFWERWHISLSSWLQDYLFTPLVWSSWQTNLPIIGKKWTSPPMLTAIFLTFTVSGLWHGSTINFLIWGLCHAFYRIFETLMRKYYKKPDKRPKPLKRTAKTLWCFSLVTFSYIFFRAKSVSDAFYVIFNGVRDWSITNFASESLDIIAHGFSARPPLILGYILFAIFTVSIAVYMDVYRCFTLKGKCLTLYFTNINTATRWLVYYMLLAFISCAFIMNSGYYAGASFAYGGF